MGRVLGRITDWLETKSEIGKERHPPPKQRESIRIWVLAQQSWRNFALSERAFLHETERKDTENYEPKLVSR
jgi:hypothetical protein